MAKFAPKQTFVFFVRGEIIRIKSFSHQAAIQILRRNIRRGVYA